MQGALSLSLSLSLVALIIRGHDPEGMTYVRLSAGSGKWCPRQPPPPSASHPPPPPIMLLTAQILVYNKQTDEIVRLELFMLFSEF